MADSKKFKQNIEELISQDYKVEFLGKNFDKIVSLLSDTKAQKIYK